MADKPIRIIIVYWGRRGALPQFTFEVATASFADEDFESTVSISRQNKDIERFLEFGDAILPVNTFTSVVDALLRSYRIYVIRRKLYRHIIQNDTQLVIELMPHVWSRAIMPVVRRAGARYCTVIHDYKAHSGDYKSFWFMPLMNRVIALADVVITLSSVVKCQIIERQPEVASKVHKIFHPDLTFRDIRRRPTYSFGRPPRLLFVGRIMKYKGLSLFLDTIDLLRDRNFPVEIGVFGSGSLKTYHDRLERMGAEVKNYWISDREFGDALGSYDALVLSHIEASQSGIAAAAFGGGLPVVVTPVGGLTEQVINGINGIIAESAGAADLATAVEKLFSDPDFYNEICNNIVRSREQRSAKRFLTDVVSHAQVHFNAKQD